MDGSRTGGWGGTKRVKGGTRRERKGITSSALAVAVIVLLSGVPPGPSASERQIERSPQRSRQRTTTIDAVGPVNRRYVIRMKGALDGSVNSPFGVVAWQRAFEPNLRVTLENTGDTAVAGAWLSVNGRPWRTVEDLYQEATSSLTSPAEKALSIYQFLRQTLGVFPSAASYYPQPLELANSYGGGLCGPINSLAWNLWSLAGLPVRQVADAEHVNTEVMYDGKWHLFDVHYGFFPLLRETGEIASAAQVMAHPERIQPIHMGGVLLDDAAAAQKLQRDWRVLFGQEPRAVPVVFPNAQVCLSLPSGTRLVLDWGEPSGCLNQLHPELESSCDQVIANGRLLYEPDLTKISHVKQLARVENMGATRQGLASIDRTKDAEVDTAHEFPFNPFRGELRLVVEPEGDAPVKLRVLSSYIGAEWTLKTDREVRESTIVTVPFGVTDFLGPEGVPNVGSGLHVSIRMTGAAVLASFRMQIWFQVGRSALPGLRLGDNEILYQDQTQEPHSLRIVHEWLEDDSSPALAVAAPRWPTDGAVGITGSNLRLEWQDGGNRAGPASSYFVRVSERADARWAFSSSVDRLIVGARTGAAVPSFQVPDGVLIAGRTYYWCVWRRDSRGFWSRRSPIWRFTVYREVHR
jgi:hypothetical protein